MKGSKKGDLFTRKSKLKKDGLSGWGFGKEDAQYREEIGINAWFEDRKRSGREGGYVCALVESFERQEQSRRLKSRNSSSRSQPNSVKLTRDNSANENPRPKVSFSVNDEVTKSHLNQLDHQDEVNWKGQSIVRSGQYSSNAQNEVELSQENLAIGNLARYEERLRKQREGRLRKTVSVVQKTACQKENGAAKQPANVASVTFAEGIIRPINELDSSSKRSTRKDVSETKLPLIFNEVRSKTKVYGVEQNSSIEREKSKETRLSKNQSSQAKKFNFDILEKYASIRSSKFANKNTEATFMDYVEKMRGLRHCSLEIADDNQSGFDAQKLEEDENSRLFKKVVGDGPTIEEVRELWYESRREKRVCRMARRARSLPSQCNMKTLVVDSKRSRCNSEPIDHKEGVTSHKVKFNYKHQKCPLQRMLSATNRRLETIENQSKQEKYRRKGLEKETVDLKRTKNGIQCCILGRSSPSNNSTKLK